jgi:hypothetical protein
MKRLDESGKRLDDGDCQMFGACGCNVRTQGSGAAGRGRVGSAVMECQEILLASLPLSTLDAIALALVSLSA